MDEDGYPDDEELDAIQAWPGRDGAALMAQVRKLWHWPHYATVTQDGDKLRHEFCTGGWSGNESLIGALKRNTMAWCLYWQLSERGGRYVFETPNVRANLPP